MMSQDVWGQTVVRLLGPLLENNNGNTLDDASVCCVHTQTCAATFVGPSG